MPIPVGYSDIYITAVRTADGRVDIYGITDFQWEGGFAGSGQLTVNEFIEWLDGGGTAHVRTTTGDLGPEVHVVNDPDGRYVRSNPDETTTDNLLMLPRF